MVMKALRGAMAQSGTPSAPPAASGGQPGMVMPPQQIIANMPHESPHVYRYDQYLAQGKKGCFELLPAGEIRKLRDNYVKLRDSDPPENARATDIQLSAVA